MTISIEKFIVGAFLLAIGCPGHVAVRHSLVDSICLVEFVFWLITWRQCDSDGPVDAELLRCCTLGT